MILNAENIKAGGQPNGLGHSWNAEQIAILGIKWPPRKGWIVDLIGKEIPDESYERFLAARKGAEDPRQGQLF
jgi:hypothetical protein